MKTYEVESQGYKLNFPGPATVEEYNEKAKDPKDPNPCLTDAVYNVAYRATLPRFWKFAMPKLAEKYALPIGVDEKATARAKDRAKDDEARAKVKDVPEKFSDYVPRLEEHVAANSGDEEAGKAALAELDTYIVSLSADFAIDPTPSARGAARGPGKQNLEKADSWLALPTDELEKKVSGALSAVGEFDLDRDEASGKPERESLAFLIKAYVEYIYANA